MNTMTTAMNTNTTKGGMGPMLDELVPSRYALKVGEIDVLVISDGILSLPTKMLAHDADPAVRAAWLKIRTPEALARLPVEADGGVAHRVGLAVDARHEVGGPADARRDLGQGRGLRIGEVAHQGEGGTDRVDGLDRGTDRAGGGLGARPQADLVGLAKARRLL